jgi:hypothetical protein
MKIFNPPNQPENLLAVASLVDQLTDDTSVL